MLETNCHCQQLNVEQQIGPATAVQIGYVGTRGHRLGVMLDINAPQPSAAGVAQARRPFNALGYPFTPAVFALMSLMMVINAVYRDPVGSRAGVLVIAAGLPLYWWFARRAAG